MTQSPPPGYTAPQPLGQTDERLWATLIHIGGIVIGFIAPLVGYLVLKDRSIFVEQNAKNALNFQITLVIAYIAAYILTIISLGLLFFLPLAVWVLSIIFSIIAAVAANRGEVYKYPLTINFIK